MTGWALAPHVVTWEITRACQLHCRHCRAKALPRRDPNELTLDEMLPVLDDLQHGFAHAPILVLTGGDPLERPDLSEIITRAVSRNLTVAVAPSVTPRLNMAVIRHWKYLGVHAISLSMDGAEAAIHDGFRGVSGTFHRTLELADYIVEQGIALQINSSISQQTVHQFQQMAEMVRFLGVTSWEVFFVIPTGRAQLKDALSAVEMENALRWLAEWSSDQMFRVTTVGAPQWSRILHERYPDVPARVIAREARGFAFINHQGLVYPSGYLPVSAGDVRVTPFSEIYQHSPLFQTLRDPDLLAGVCGQCDYRVACGGSRARAYAVTNHLTADDPGCPQTIATSLNPY